MGEAVIVVFVRESPLHLSDHLSPADSCVSLRIRSMEVTLESLVRKGYPGMDWDFCYYSG